MTAKNPLRVTDTILRDAHQSLLATRMRTEDMIPVAQKLDNVGYWSIEMWGGATFDTTMRFLDENPWDRLRILKEHMPKTPFQMLLRGQNVVGYKHYPDDILDAFVTKAHTNGIDVFRIFDALNDTRNMRKAIEVVKREGGHAQAAVSYTLSPVHTIEGYVALGKELKEMGADSICIKDMAGMASPYHLYDLVKGLKEQVGLLVHFHTHYTSGMGLACAVKAAEAGCDIVDTAISSMSGLTSQPPTESLVACMEGTDRDTGLDLNVLAEMAGYFGEVRKKYAAFESGMKGVDVRVLQFQVPGGMLSNLVSQLRQQGAEDKYEEVLAEVPRVRAELGYPPLVTPSSQFVGTQATLNVVLGERYKMVPEEIRNYVRGYYGRPPAPVDPEVQKKIIGDEKPIECRYADLLEPGMDKARQEIGDLAESDEDVLLYAIFPQVAKPFLERRKKGVVGKPSLVAAIAAGAIRDAQKKQDQDTQQQAGISRPVAAAGVPGFDPWRMSGRPTGNHWS